MANLKYGSTGDEVKKLQESLGFTGNDVDGVFGQRTQKAVMDYQRANNLAVDGIVGENTWNALNKSSAETTQNAAQETAPSTGGAGFTYKPYQKSDAVAQAEAMLQQHLSQKPGAYTSAWQAQLDDTLKKILNREEFSYDLNGDALYQQYKDQYTTQGQMAMMDAMGQAAALNGGYGSSYAQQVGQQTYQGYLQQLNDRVPELYQLALDQYNRKGDELYNQYALYADKDAQDYGRYRDQMGDYYTELDRLTGDARYQGEQDYGKWADKLNLDYGMYRDQVADQQWQAQFDEAKRQYDQQYELQNGKKTTSNPGGGKEKCPKCGKLKSECVCPKLVATDATDTFETTLTPETRYDAIMRDKWGSYRGYVGAMIERAETAGKLTQDEADYLAAKYKISSADKKN